MRGLLTAIMIGEAGRTGQRCGRPIDEGRGRIARIWHFAARQPNDALVDGPTCSFVPAGASGQSIWTVTSCSGSMLSGTVKAGSRAVWLERESNMTLGSSGCPTVRILVEESNQCGQHVDVAPGVLGHWDVNGGFGACHGHAL